VTSTRLRDFIAHIHDVIDGDPGLAIGVTLATIFVPLLVGLAVRRRDEA
jgi:hypothetical protein